jgi:hypothetical protein
MLFGLLGKVAISIKKIHLTAENAENAEKNQYGFSLRSLRLILLIFAFVV